MTRTEKFAERLWGYLREHRDSLDSERWCRHIVEEVDHQVQAGITPLQIKIDDLELKLAEAKEKLKAERQFTDLMRSRVADSA
jgi:hypothetical protein